MVWLEFNLHGNLRGIKDKNGKSLQHDHAAASLDDCGLVAGGARARDALLYVPPAVPNLVPTKIKTAPRYEPFSSL
jgi:hypothetical protein